MSDQRNPQVLGGHMSKTTFLRYLAVSFVFLVLYFAYSVAAFQITQKLRIDVPETREMASEWFVFIKSHILLGSFILLMSAMFEEAVFRLIPLSLFLLIPKLEKFWIAPVLASSFLFGYLHGTIVHMYIIGGMGLVFGVQTVAYWKIVGQKDLAGASIATAFTHFTWNFMMAYVL